jgi:hypothetical protein
MSYEPSPQWQAAVTAWNQLNHSQQNYAIGWIASQQAALVTEAAAEALAKAMPATGTANTAVAHLDTRGMRDVLNLLAMQAPGLLTAAIEQAEG